MDGGPLLYTTTLSGLLAFGFRSRRSGVISFFYLSRDPRHNVIKEILFLVAAHHLDLPSYQIW